MSYLYVKKQPPENLFFWRLVKLVPVIIFVTGLLALSYAGWPIISYQLKSWGKFRADTLISPYYSLAKVNSFLAVSGEEKNLTQVKNWLPTNASNGINNRGEYYSLSIPQLEISNAIVRVGGEDLSRSLIQYGGTAYPGDYGNAVVFGHSVLPQFFNPKDYMTIFSLLPTLEYGDEIIVDFDGARYRYQVEEMVEVKPDDLSILEQHYDDSYVSLVTCVPPGTYLRRLVVRARLIN
jgi:sortase A